MDAEFEALKREFLEEAVAKVVEIEASLRTGDEHGRARVVYLAHQLKGAGGSYGFQEISKVAAEIERAVESVRKSPGDQSDTITERVRNLRREIEARTQELG